MNSVDKILELLKADREICEKATPVDGLDFDYIDRLAECFELNGNISPAKQRTLDILSLAYAGQHFRNVLESRAKALEIAVAALKLYESREYESRCESDGQLQWDAERAIKEIAQAMGVEK